MEAIIQEVVEIIIREVVEIIIQVAAGVLLDMVLMVTTVRVNPTPLSRVSL